MSGPQAILLCVTMVRNEILGFVGNNCILGIYDFNLYPSVVEWKDLRLRHEAT